MNIVAFGNAFDGLACYGPFDDVEVVVTYAEHEAGSEEWHVVPCSAVMSNAEAERQRIRDQQCGACWAPDPDGDEE